LGEVVKRSRSVGAEAQAAEAEEAEADGVETMLAQRGGMGLEWITKTRRSIVSNLDRQVLQSLLLGLGGEGEGPAEMRG
jgi:hypothetical protein